LDLGARREIKMKNNKRMRLFLVSQTVRKYCSRETGDTMVANVARKRVGR
jgi:hypothetical protein